MGARTDTNSEHEPRRRGGGSHDEDHPDTVGDRAGTRAPGRVQPRRAGAQRDQIDDVTTALLDPNVLNPAGWRGSTIKYIQPSPNLPKDFSCALQTAEWVMTDLFVNPQLVPPDSLRSWRDLLKPEYRGKIA